MPFKKIACNATNSAAIDSNDYLWVWGSCKHGLCGNSREKMCNFEPKAFELKDDSAGQRQMQAFSKENQKIEYKVKDIAMGTFHMMALAFDSQLQTDFQIYEYASELLQNLRKLLLSETVAQLAYKEIKKLETNDRNNKKWEEYKKNLEQSIDETVKIETILEIFNYTEKNNWPYGSTEFFHDLIIQKAGVTFNPANEHIIKRLEVDLQKENDDSMINLKNLRDQIIGRKSTSNVVFGWGLNDQRLMTSKKEPIASTKPGIKKKDILGTNLTGIPKEMPFQLDVEVEKIVCGDSYTIVLDSKGNVWSWGIGKSGSLGLGETQAETDKAMQVQFRKPKLLFQKNQIHIEEDDLLSDLSEDEGREKKTKCQVKIKAIKSGASHCLALTESGVVYSWGNGQGGRLGHQDVIGKSTPEQIMSIHEKVEEIECGDSHSGCITENGQVYVWGVGLNGRLGVGIDTNCIIPTHIQELSIYQCKRVYFGMNSCFLVTKSDELYCWGSGESGKLGIPNSSDTNFLTPRKLYTLKGSRISEFACGPFHTLALTSEGRIFAFGDLKDGKLGIVQSQEFGANTDGGSAQNIIDRPTLITRGPAQFYKEKLNKMLFETFTKFSDYTQIGILKTDKKQNEEQRLRVVQVACADRNTYFLLSNGKVYAAGANDLWQCTRLKDKIDDHIAIAPEYLLTGGGEGDEEEKKKETDLADDVIPREAAAIIKLALRRQPVPEPHPITITNKKNLKQEILIKHVSTGAAHCLAVTNTGLVYAWGDNRMGQLGLGKFGGESKLSKAGAAAGGAAGGGLGGGDASASCKKPTLVLELQEKRMKMTAAGVNHSLFLSDLGHVYSAGYDEFGQLGVRTDDFNVDYENETTAVRRQGNLAAANYRQLKGRPTPKRIDTLSNIRLIACGAHHSMAISDTNAGELRESSLYTWGWGAYGQLGHDDVRNAYNVDEPKKVRFHHSHDTRVAWVSAGSKHTLCVDSEGALFYFGSREAVGIPGRDNAMQFYPVRLLPKDGAADASEIDKGFAYCASSPSMNLVIASEGRAVYTFGRDMLEQAYRRQHDRYRSRKTGGRIVPHGAGLSDFPDEDEGGIEHAKAHRTQFQRVSIPAASASEEASYQACLVACGPRHAALVDSGVSCPYVWGENSDHRLGINLKESSKSKRRAVESTVVTVPTPNTALFEVLEKGSAKLEQWIKQLKLPGGGATTPHGLGERGGDDGELAAVYGGQQAKQLRFPVQRELKHGQAGQAGDAALIQQDTQLVAQFGQAVREYHALLRGMEQGIAMQMTRAQDGLITRILKFPTAIDVHRGSFTPPIPRGILECKQEYERIFTCLQTHPCYVTRWVLNTNAIDDPRDLRRRLRAIYGRREIVDNQRLLRTLLVVARKVFDHELERNTIKELTFRTESSQFRVIFNMIFESQTCNMEFVRTIISSMLVEIDGDRRRHAEAQADGGGGRGRAGTSGGGGLDLDTDRGATADGDGEGQGQRAPGRPGEPRSPLDDACLGAIRKKIETLEGLDVRRVQAPGGLYQNVSIEILTLLKYAYKRLTEKARSEVARREKAGGMGVDDEPGSSGQGTSGNAAMGASQAAGGSTASRGMGDESRIVPYLLGLLFEKLLEVLRELTMDQIRYEYWSLLEEGSLDIHEGTFNTAKGDGTIPRVASRLHEYFRHPEPLGPGAGGRAGGGAGSGGVERDGAKGGEREGEGGAFPYRREFARILFERDQETALDLDFVLMQQLFHTSIEVANPKVSVSVDDVIVLRNHMAKHMDQVGQGKASDPIWRELVHIDLKRRKQLVDPAKINYEEHEVMPIDIDKFDRDTKRARLNLEISCRLLINKSEFVKCHECHAPLTRDMVSKDRFEASFHPDPEWFCKCRIKYLAEEIYCKSDTCKYNGRQTDEKLNKRDLIFQRFINQKADEDVQLFSYALTVIPDIENNQEVYQTIQQYMDVQKLEKGESQQNTENNRLDYFRKKLFDFISQDKAGAFKNIDSTLKKIDQENKEKIRNILNEKAFLARLHLEIVQQIQRKKTHMNLVKNYNNAMFEINQMKQLVKQRSLRVAQEFEQILRNSYTGLSSDFLNLQLKMMRGKFESDADQSKNEKRKEKVWAGSLHLGPDQGKKAKKKKKDADDFIIGQAKGKKNVSKDVKLQEFFEEIGFERALKITHASNDPKRKKKDVGISEEAAAESLGKEIVRQANQQSGFSKNSDRTISGTIKYTKLLELNVIKKVEEFSGDVLRDSRYLFQDNGRGGFKVEHVFKEPNNPTMVGKPKQDTVILESFEISRDEMLGMRRLYGCNMTVKMKNTEFDIFNLVNVLNRIISQNDIFQFLMIESKNASRDDNDQRQDRQGNKAIKRQGGAGSGDEDDDDEDEGKSKDEKKGGKKGKGKDRSSKKAKNSAE